MNIPIRSVSGSPLRSLLVCPLFFLCLPRSFVSLYIDLLRQFGKLLVRFLFFFEGFPQVTKHAHIRPTLPQTCALSHMQQSHNAPHVEQHLLMRHPAEHLQSLLPLFPSLPLSNSEEAALAILGRAFTS